MRRYPFGYSLLFIPFYAGAYTGNHWAVYNQDGQFWGYDDGDITNGDYDYDSGDGLPAGCQNSAPGAAAAAGAIDLTAPAPAPGPAGAGFGDPTTNASSGNLTAGGLSGNSTAGRQLICKPLSAAVTADDQSISSGWSTGQIVGVVAGVVAGVVLLLALICCIIPACIKSCKKRQSEWHRANMQHELDWHGTQQMQMASNRPADSLAKV